MSRLRVVAFVLLAAAASSAQQLPTDDAVRIAEFYRLISAIQDRVWPNWSAIAAPILLVTDSNEFLTRWPKDAPDGFTRVADDLYVRPRNFPVRVLATFPAFGPPSVMAVGEPQNTEAKGSTPWLFVLMHEHFHQLEYSQAGYDGDAKALNLSHGDNSGGWMLNYPFPYDDPKVASGFAHLRDMLLEALNEKDEAKFRPLAAAYVRERRRVLSALSQDDHKYISFQLWQEGIARYVQIKCAEVAADYKPSAAFAALTDYEPFSRYAGEARQKTLDELKNADLAKMKRVFVYAFGGSEGLLLDRINPGWQKDYFKHMLSTDDLFTP